MVATNMSILDWLARSSCAMMMGAGVTLYMSFMMRSWVPTELAFTV